MHQKRLARRSGEAREPLKKFAAPGVRGELIEPSYRIFAFDGQHLGELDPTSGVLTHWDLSNLDRARADTFLHQVFAPFAPEGRATSR